MASSPDGSTWTSISIVTSSTLVNNNFNAIAYGNGKWVAGTNYSGEIAHSSDGINWTVTDSKFKEASDSTSANYYINGIAYGDNKWVAVGEMSFGTSDYRLSVSTDNGITWAPIENDAVFKDSSSNYLNAVAYGGGKFVAVGTNKSAYSSDGTIWTAIDNVLNNGAHRVAYGNGKFVAGYGAFGSIAYSPDGITWTSAADTGLTKVAIEGIAYGNNTFVVINNLGGIAYSTGL
jgi:hypothetical protein